MSSEHAIGILRSDPPSTTNGHLGNADAEREKMSLAAKFDRLVDSNLKLTSSVERLVTVSYLILGASFVGTMISVIFR